MATLLEEITEYVAAQTGWTLDTDIFSYGFPPEGADTAVALLDGPGTPESVRPLCEIGNYDIQVLARSREPATAAARARSVRSILHGVCKVTLVVGSVWEVHYITAVQEPYPLGYDSRGRYEYVNHYRVRATAA